ncbi:MAG TPA: hypothetical protein VFX80_09830 [Solirubrobacteraceae bacterium]|nr:hypothetical protein [Solirubrobacteraceae bacterium]
MPLLLEVLLEQPDDIVTSHGAGVDDEPLVDGDLVVLGLQCA